MAHRCSLKQPKTVRVGVRVLDCRHVLFFFFFDSSGIRVVNSARWTVTSKQLVDFFLVANVFDFRKITEQESHVLLVRPCQGWRAFPRNRAHDTRHLSNIRDIGAR